MNYGTVARRCTSELRRLRENGGLSFIGLGELYSMASLASKFPNDAIMGDPDIQPADEDGIFRQVVRPYMEEFFARPTEDDLAEQDRVARRFNSSLEVLANNAGTSVSDLIMSRDGFSVSGSYQNSLATIYR